MQIGVAHSPSHGHVSLSQPRLTQHIPNVTSLSITPSKKARAQHVSTEKHGPMRPWKASPTARRQRRNLAISERMTVGRLKISKKCQVLPSANMD
jgi:hypothetical protein